MNVLQALSPTARVLLTPEFRNGTVPAIDATSLLSDPGFGRTISLDPLEAVIAEARQRFEFKPSESDPWLGPRVHATLRLTRREAADKRIWEYLTIVRFPDFVRWRWLKQDDPEAVVPFDRFLGEDGKNALARLWWASELTRNGTDYARSEAALGNSRFSVSWLHLNLIHHRPAALAAVDFLREFQTKGATDTQGQVMAKAVNLALRTISLDALAANPPTDAEAVQDWIAEPFDVTTFLDELPTGPDERPVPVGDIDAVRKLLDDLATRIKLSEVKGERKTITQYEVPSEPVSDVIQADNP